MDPRVQFSLPKSYYKQKFVFDILQKKLIECVFLKKILICMPKIQNLHA